MDESQPSPNLGATTNAVPKPVWTTRPSILFGGPNTMVDWTHENVNVGTRHTPQMKRKKPHLGGGREENKDYMRQSTPPQAG